MPYDVHSNCVRSAMNNCGVMDGIAVIGNASAPVGRVQDSYRHRVNGAKS